MCAVLGPSWHRLKPQLWGSGQIPEVAVTLCSHAPAFPNTGHGSCVALELPRPPSLPGALSSPSGTLSVLELVVESSHVPGFGDKRGRCFSSPKASSHIGSLAFAQGWREKSGCLFHCFWRRSLNSCAELPALHAARVGTEVGV